MSLEYSDRICPFWNYPLCGDSKCVCLVSEEFCSFKYAKDRFLDCGIYLTEMEKRIKKIKEG